MILDKCNQVAYTCAMLNPFKKQEHKCEDELKEFNLKATPARVEVLRFFETQGPVDAGEILDYLKNNNIRVDRATVFRMMNDFLKKGVTHEVQVKKGKISYELNSKGDHHHLICENCGKVQTISDTVIPQMEKEIEKANKFFVKRHALEFFGLCSDCKK